MRIVIAPDKFKGCLSAQAVAAAIAEGLRRVDPIISLEICPLADGGEGIVSALVADVGGRLVRRQVVGPLPEMTVDAAFGLVGDGNTAVVEMAAASGLALLAIDRRDPMATTSFGAGQLLVAAAEAGARRIILGVGGSATIDAGIGCAQACGIPVLLNDGEPTADSEPLVGRDLEKVVLIKHGRGGKLDRVSIEVACDVTNPLCGKNGAAAVFGPQKGATPEQVIWFDRQLQRLAERTGNQAIAELPGAGAAGGLAFAMAAFFGATLRSGIDLVMETVGFRKRLEGADLCITGEGMLDDSTWSGKTVSGVARLCKSMGIRCISICGGIDPKTDYRSHGISAALAIADKVGTTSESHRQAESLISAAAAEILGEEIKRS
jgi:glycerate 2-kinase